MTLLIETPDSRAPERDYVLEVLFDRFLGIPWRRRPSDRADVTISLPGQSGQVRLPDELFSFPAEKWLTPASMPRRPLPVWDTRELRLDITLVEPTLPVIVGDGEPSGGCDGSEIYLPVDIFGSAFFMLTRFEELIVPLRDEHDRFPAMASLAYQEGFLERPIIDEYVELLWAAMKRLWPRLERKPHHFRQSISCDVDRPFDRTIYGSRNILRRLAGDVVKRRNPSLAWDTARYAYHVRRDGVAADRMWRFPWMMAVCEEADMRCAFYFLTDSRHLRDGESYWGRPEIERLLSEIHARGHEIGLHTSYTTYDNAGQTRSEFSNLIRACDKLGITQPEWGARQHYLRWKAPVTWRNFSASGLQYDATLTFADVPGFRSGTCHAHPAYDLEHRRKLDLEERPLIVMECSLLGSIYQGLSLAEAAEKICRLKGICKTFSGTFSLLWHNSYFLEDGYSEVYRDAVVKPAETIT